MSQIKLLTASSGSIALEPTNTASNLVITVPAVTGTMATVDGSGNMSVTGNLSFNSGYGSSAVAYGCRAWVNFNGTGTVAIRASGNVSSITDNGLGDYTVNFTTAMSDANYSIVAFAQQSATKVLISGNPDGVAPTTTAYKLVTSVGGGGTSHVDATYVFAAVFR